jgi:hypothetical protein
MPPNDTPEGFVRPFLARGLKPKPSAADEPVADTGVPAVRSYMITGGRTHTDGVRLEFESMLSITRLGENRAANMPFEKGKALALIAAGELSVAEVAARVQIPIGVAKVLCADLISDGLAEAHTADADVANDVSLLTRLIQGVRAL